MKSTSKNGLWNREYTLLIIINLITNTGFGMLLTSVSMYALSIGATLAIAGTMASIFSLVAMLTRPFGGRLFDRFNKKNSFIISTLAFGLLAMCYAFTSNVTVLFILRIIHGITFSLSGVTNMALVSLYISKDRMNEGLGYYSATMLLGQAIAPTIAEILRTSVGFFWLYIIVGLLIMIPPLLCIPMKVPADEEAPAVKEKTKFSIRQYIVPSLILYALVCATFSFYNGICNSFILLVGQERNVANISYFFTVCSVVLLGSRILMGKMTDRIDLTVLVSGALVVSIISMLMCTNTASLFVFLIAALFKALGQGIGQVALQGESIKRADINSVGIASSTILIGNDLGNTIGPAMGGFVSEAVGYPAMFVCGAAVFAVALAAFLIYQKKKPNTAR